MNLDRFGPIAKGAVSLLVIAGFFGIVSALFYMALGDKDFPPGIRETLLVLVGVLAGEFKNVCSYWLGSTHSSARKTEMLAQGNTP
jgi:hypothetical protein